jgi:hypothetical protein
LGSFSMLFLTHPSIPTPQPSHLCFNQLSASHT